MNNRRNATAEPMAAPLRCAIYTRKSTDEGLEQEFNSLDAQRESAESFIASQRQNGWIPVDDRYDDGGFSGGTLERPALQRLIQDIEAGKIQCVVVYKIDRLSRSLLDFTRLVDLFDRHGVSFVSVTQQFNTTTSMGRLTLNILLSFAQFEREIIGERIRDKVAAAKRKGKYMGGPPVLGYDPDAGTRRLMVNSEEASLVRHIFSRFVELGSTLKLAQELNQQGRRTKSWTTRGGRKHEGGRWDKASLARLLRNHLYIGEVAYKGEIYAGEHEAIVTRSAWDKAQATLDRNDRTNGNRNRKRHDSLLRGVLRCGHCDCGMTHSYARKKGAMYRYYVCANAMKHGYASCPMKSIPAGEVERMVIDRLRQVLRSPALIAQTYREAVAASPGDAPPFAERDVVLALERLDELWDNLFPGEQARIAQLLIQCVVATKDSLNIELRAHGMLELTVEMNTAEEDGSDGKTD